MNITYLLGAGASARALPVVSEMNKKLKGLKTSIKHILESEDRKKLEPETIVAASELSSNLEWLHNNTRDKTVDSYALELYKREDDTSLIRLKSTLSIFFSLLQTQGYSDTPNIDPRYKDWLPRMVKKGYALSDAINILTWNYDVQIELNHSITTDQNIEESTCYLNSFPSNYCFENPQILPKVIHLNGIAGFYEPNESIARPEIKHTLYHCNGFINALNAIAKCVFLDQKDIYFGQLFSFAFEEDNPYSVQAMKHAKSIASNTEVLVVIGYSFPPDNHKFDMEIIEQMKSSLHAVYLFDNFDRRDKIKRRFSLSNVDIQFEHANNGNAPFFIPSELTMASRSKYSIG